MKQLLLSFLLWSVAAFSYAQHTYFPRDTAYSIHSSFIKISKKYPQVKPIWEKMPKQVKAFRNLVYLELQNGRKLHLDVFQPQKVKHNKCPVVLMIHGGGWIHGSKENLIPMAQQLAKNGFVAMTVEYRLGGESPYPAAVYDLKTAVRWIRANAKTYHIDTNKIAVYGCSAGAHLATLLGTTNLQTHFDEHQDYANYSAQVHAILNIDGIVSFTHPEAKPEWTGRSANAWLGDFNEHVNRWQAASPLKYVDENTPPTLFVNSSQPRFHAGRDDFIAILNQHNTYHKTYTFDDAPHAFWLLDPWFEPTLKYSIRFLKKVF